MQKSRSFLFSRIQDFFSKKTDIEDEIYHELEELLITSDLGVGTSQALLAELKEETERVADLDEYALRGTLKRRICQILSSADEPEIRPRRIEGMPFVVIMVGVNGVGKTTTIGKLAQQFHQRGQKVLLGACDTFRAAAVEQITEWGNRVGVDVFAGDEKAKPTTVAYQAVHKAQDEDYDVVIIDTAGRLHTRTNLMNELRNVIQMIDREQPGAPHETILVIDASTGQNALQQAREFHKNASLTGIIVTKLDGTPKGGIIVAVKDELGIPIRYIGIGEGLADLHPFSAADFADALFEGEIVEAELRDEAVAAPGGRGNRKARRGRRGVLTSVV